MEALYLSPKTVAKQERKKNVLTVTGGVLTVFFCFGLIGGILDYSQGLREGILVYLVFLIPSVLLLRKGIRVGKRIKAARRYETVFAIDRDGVVSLEELTKQTGKPAVKVLEELEELFQNGYFQNCSLQKSGEPCVRMGDAMTGENRIGFVTVVCQNCGAASRIRAGSRGRCDHCGSPIADSQVPQ